MVKDYKSPWVTDIPVVKQRVKCFCIPARVMYENYVEGEDSSSGITYIKMERLTFLVHCIRERVGFEIVAVYKPTEDGKHELIDLGDYQLNELKAYIRRYYAR